MLTSQFHPYIMADSVISHVRYSLSRYHLSTQDEKEHGWNWVKKG